MLGKSGVEDAEGILEGCADQNCVMLHCARNIARCWWIEHFECQKGNNDISFLGEVVMLQGLMPLALWLRVQEYGGIWHHGGGEDHFEGHERLGAVGDCRLTALSDTLSVYGNRTTVWGAMQPAWYWDQFVEWADEISCLWVLPKLERHNPILRRDWCGLLGCPYLYVTKRILAPTHGIPGVQVLAEPSQPTHVHNRLLYPKWGVYLCDSKEGKLKVEEEENDENAGDYSPFSVE